MDEPSKPAKASQRTPRAEVLGADFSKLSAVELGAQRGIGPLSPKGEIVWHGESRPCVSCGQLVRRTASQCDQCGQLLTGEMIYRMRLHSGPWYVLEHIRPFPGVSKERIILQIRRGVLTQTTIIRGPSTHHQWRYAAEAPGVSKYLGVCWACQATVHEDDTTCPICRKNLDSDGEEVLIEGDETLDQGSPSRDRLPFTRSVKGQGADSPEELDELSAAVRSAAPRRRDADGPARIAGIPAWWIVTALVILVMAVVYLVVRTRGERRIHEIPETTDRAPLVVPVPQGAEPTTALDAGRPQGTPAPTD